MFKKYVRKQEAVEAVQLDDISYESVFEFLTGYAAKDRGVGRMTRQIVFQDRHGEKRMLLFGEWVVNTNNGMFIFSNDDFAAAFSLLDAPPAVWVDNSPTERLPVFVDSPPKDKLDS